VFSPAVDVSAIFCFNQCNHGANANIVDEALNTCMTEEVIETIKKTVLEHD
jgi:hypothetical protein